MFEHDMNFALPSTGLDWRHTCAGSNIDSIASKSEAETALDPQARQAM
jgi:hypothetical protein